ncbi:LOW QUALITY PROTEIN: dimethylglycine dehydrogenase, mitochondrial-like [Pollicipes pollicipes]|uniref:LOW QUALITY PROTEIN: dimethylglycine dehydrogenase, mitochondrial-like n=1 Tax=Pollicipes pollicipes TaxID=41117 RepID=UPI001884FD9F|nr:LOW QUALITY PROTEIN: dimethylglycine dehydrogenase, mitochondrial-like [Pollicipes pollicipes]
MSRSGHLKNPQKIANPDEVYDLCPILNMEGIKGGLYSPYDGHIDPYSLTQALAAGARLYGATVRPHSEVTALRLLEDGRWEVTLPQGTLRAQRLVNAAGFWAKEVGKMAGEDLPLVPIHHQYVVTSSIPEVKALKREFPVLRHLEGSYYVRQERDGLLIGPYEHPDRMSLSEDWVLRGVRPGFGRELFPPDLDRIEPNLEMAMELLPCFAEASIQSVVNGPITYSPDVLPMVGPTLLPNMWAAVGFGYGIVHGGGVGKFLADWIQQGEPPYDLIEVDPCRYGPWTTDSYSLAKCRESYGMNTALGLPREERWAGRPTSRVSGAHAQLVARGASMEQHTGWEQPAWFAEPGTEPEYRPSFQRTNWHERVGDECRTVMERVGVIDITPFAKFYLSGPDARALLEYATANTIPATWRTCITHCLTPGGKVMAELTLTSLPDERFLIITGTGSEFHDLRWLNELVRQKNFNVSFENATEATGVLSIAGPKSWDLLKKLTDHDVSKFPFLSVKEIELAGVKSLAMRISYTGELGWELYHPREQTGRLYEAILKAGKEFGIGDFGTHALGVMRIEKGFRGWGSEMNCDVGPHEAGLGMFIRSDKEYVGKAAAERSRRMGLQKMVVHLSIDSDNVDPIGDETVYLHDKVVGNTTSGCYSHNTGQTLAMAYVPPYLAVAGTEVQVALLGERRPAVVLPGPPLLTQPARDALKRKATKAKAK